MQKFTLSALVLLIFLTLSPGFTASPAYEPMLKKFVAALKANDPKPLLPIMFNRKNTLRFLEKVKQHCGKQSYETNKNMLFMAYGEQQHDAKTMKKFLSDFNDIRKSQADKHWQHAKLLSAKVIKSSKECGTLYLSISMKVQVGPKTLSIVLTTLNIDSDWILQLFVQDILNRY